MYCAKCGAEITEGSKFCGKCGASVEMIKSVETDVARSKDIRPEVKAQSKLTNEVNEKKRSPVPLLAGTAVFLAAVLGAGGFFLFRGNDDYKSADTAIDENAVVGGNMYATKNEDTEDDADGYPVQINVYAAADVRTDEDSSLLRDLLTGAKVSLRAGAGSYTGEVLQTMEADGDGRVNTVLPTGIYTAQIDVEGYTPAYVTVDVEEKETTAEGYVLPILEEGQTGIVLTWDGEADLDLTLFTPYQSTDGDMLYIGGSIMNDRYGNRLVTDNDAVCEVMYVNTAAPGDYKLYVNNYTESEAGNYSSGKFSVMNTHIYIYDSTGLIAEYSFPEKQTGVVWEVAEINGSQVTPSQRVYSSLERKSWWTADKRALDLEESPKLQRLLNNMALTAWWSNGKRWVGNDGTTYLDVANGMQTWADSLYQGKWKELGDLVSAVSFWQETPYVTEPFDMPEYGQNPMDDPMYGVSLTKEQMEYLAYAVVGTEWKMQSVDEILCSIAAYGSEVEYNNDIIRIIDTSYDSYIWLELENVSTAYIGGGNWEIAVDGIYFDQHAPELSNTKFADITFTIARNPDSCFDGYSVIGMNVVPYSITADNMDAPITGTETAFNGVVEDEVGRIREVYSDIVSGISSEIYEKINLAEGITGYYDAGILRAVVITKGTDGIKYARWYYYDNGKLLFAYYEEADAHRFYFYEEELIRWRYSADASNAQAAVNHDMEGTGEYREWEEAVLKEGLSFK